MSRIESEAEVAVHASHVEMAEPLGSAEEAGQELELLSAARSGESRDPV